MKKTLLVIISLMIIACMALCSCKSNPSKDEGTSTTVSASDKTTDKNEKTTKSKDGKESSTLPTVEGDSEDEIVIDFDEIEDSSNEKTTKS
ncbi:MAG: hypothetical protein IKN26_08780, partial [Eubacterium sp.]|nr:hypothetical protein [Eubacterium sp.]